MSHKKAILELNDEEFAEFGKLRIQLLKETIAIISKHGGHAFLDCGTLLGAIREKDFIRWDSDMDIGIRAEELTQDMVDELRNTFELRIENNNIDKFFMGSYNLRTDNLKSKKLKFKGIDLFLDLYAYYPYKDGYRAMCMDTDEHTHNKMFLLPGVAIEKLKPYKFHGEEFLIPNIEVAWLESYYEKDYMTPRPRRVRARNYIQVDQDYNIENYKNFKTIKTLF